ncbi:MAG: MATE family efflux transporter, partial [Pseudomonadota bacterium]
MTPISLPSPAAFKTAFALAWPASLAAMITPVLGLVDTAVLARGASTADIAGVALASAAFSILYWSLGFLRMGLAGLTAQADGREDEAGVRAHLVQGVVLGATIGLFLVLFRGPIADMAVVLMGEGNNTSPEALAAMRIYIETRLLGAPFAVAFFAGVGWLTGQGRMALMMAVVIFMTFINAVLDVYFALMLEMGAQGIALGTALAEGSGAILMGLGILWVLHKRGGLKENWIPARMQENLKGVLSLNADIFLRTFCLALVFAYFTRAGGQFGDLTLAANQVLMHIVMVASLLLDGPAIAAETLVGKALGRRQEKRRASFYEAVTTTSLIGGVGALTMAMGLLFFHETIIGLVVPQGEANADLFKEALKYVPWAIIFPLILFLPFQIDGIYIGATRGRALRNSMVITAALFAAAIFLGVPALGNHGLW